LDCLASLLNFVAKYIWKQDPPYAVLFNTYVLRKQD
jgi:hypothetical protein